MREIDVLYFAWVRERIGHPKDRIETSAATVFALMEELRGRGQRYVAAFANAEAIRVAVDHELASFDSDISAANEVAFFPPMTGG